MIEELIDHEVNEIYRWSLQCMVFEVCIYIEFYPACSLSESYAGFVTNPSIFLSHNKGTIC